MIYQLANGAHIDLTKVVGVTPPEDEDRRLGEAYYSVNLQLCEKPIKVYRSQIERTSVYEVVDGENKAASYDRYKETVHIRYRQSYTDLMIAWNDYKASRAARLEALLKLLESSSDKDAVALLTALR